jgi:pyruvate formate lyase activating enzyme
MSVEEVLKEIEKDAVFFSESSGGVSFSGGEPLLQHEFLLSVLKVCKQRGYHTAVDTTGFTSQKILESIIDSVDLFLYDLKTFDDVKHVEYTGVSNRVILENLKFLVQRRKEIIVRIPVIPGVNDTSEELAKIGSFVKELGGIREIQLLPYHQTGIDKYARLGKKYEMPDLVPPSVDEMNEFADGLAHEGARISIGG